MLKIDSHTHPFQTDRSSPAGLCLYAENAIARGFSCIVFTEHAPMGIPVSRHYLNESELENYLLWAEECKKKYSGKIEISIGLECDYLPENMDYLVRLLDRCQVSYVGGSLHLHADFWKDRIAGMDPYCRYGSGFPDTVCSRPDARYGEYRDIPYCLSSGFLPVASAGISSGTVRR